MLYNIPPLLTLRDTSTWRATSWNIMQKYRSGAGDTIVPKQWDIRAWLVSTVRRNHNNILPVGEILSGIRRKDTAACQAVAFTELPAPQPSLNVQERTVTLNIGNGSIVCIRKWGRNCCGRHNHTLYTGYGKRKEKKSIHSNGLQAKRSSGSPYWGFGQNRKKVS